VTTIEGLRSPDGALVRPADASVQNVAFARRGPIVSVDMRAVDAKAARVHRVEIGHATCACNLWPPAAAHIPNYRGGRIAHRQYGSSPEKEVEGRVQEVWLVVRGQTRCQPVGRPATLLSVWTAATRVRRLERARGEASRTRTTLSFRRMLSTPRCLRCRPVTPNAQLMLTFASISTSRRAIACRLCVHGRSARWTSPLPEQKGKDLVRGGRYQGTASPPSALKHVRRWSVAACSRHAAIGWSIGAT